MRIAAIVAICVALTFCAGCVVPAAPHKVSVHPHAHHFKRYDEIQHPIVNQDGQWQYVPDSMYRSWMFEPDAQPPETQRPTETQRPNPN